MRAGAIVPDAPPAGESPAPQDSAAFARALDAIGAALDGAARSEDAFAAGGGTLQDAVYERARADVALSVAAAAAQRAAQALQTVFNMQV